MRCGKGAVKALSQSPSSSQTHPWISDEFLESTFNRFVRSQSGQHRSYHGHTPGPLEFRRRQVHRRMASMTFYDPSQHSLPSLWPTLSNLTSLFRPRPAPDTQWTWEAPAFPVAPSQTESALPSLEDSDIIPRRNYEQVLSDKYTVVDLRALYWELCPIGDDAVAFSKAACQRIHHLMGSQISVKPADALQLLLDFLHSDVNVPEAGNLLASLAWSMTNYISAMSSSLVMDHLSGCIDHGKISTNELRSVVELYHTQHKAIPFSKRGLSRLDTLCDSVEKWLSRHEGTRAQLTVADTFAEFLDSLPRKRATSSAIIRIVTKLPVAVRGDYDQLVQTHLLHCIRLAHKSGGKYRINGMLQQSLGFESNDNELSKAWCLQVLLNVTSSLIYTSRNDAGMIENWISTLKRVYVPKVDLNQDLWARLNSLFSQARERNSLLPRPSGNVQQTILTSGRPLIVNHPTSHSIIAKSTTAQIHDYLTRGEVEHAKQVFLSSSTVPLSSCEKLLFDMVSSGCFNPGDYLRILGRKDEDNSVPMSNRQDTRVSLSADRIRLIEDLAYHISISAVPSHRQAFRMVHALYRYLTANHVAAGPGMSRALVRAGVNRLLRDGIMVSRERYLWVLHVVEQAEGREVADQLDHVAGRWFENVQAQIDDAKARSTRV